MSTDHNPELSDPQATCLSSVARARQAAPYWDTAPYYPQLQPATHSITGIPKPRMWRKGKWTEEEEAYTKALTDAFNEGHLQLSYGTTLRSFLAEKLNCDPMRITKKFSGNASIGKQIYQTPEKAVDEFVLNTVDDNLKRLEALFLSKLDSRYKATEKFIVDPFLSSHADMFNFMYNPYGMKLVNDKHDAMIHNILPFSFPMPPNSTSSLPLPPQQVLDASFSFPYARSLLTGPFNLCSMSDYPIDAYAFINDPLRMGSAINGCPVKKENPILVSLANQDQSDDIAPMNESNEFTIEKKVITPVQPPTTTNTVYTLNDSALKEKLVEGSASNDIIASNLLLNFFKTASKANADAAETAKVRHSTPTVNPVPSLTEEYLLNKRSFQTTKNSNSSAGETTSSDSSDQNSDSEPEREHSSSILKSSAFSYDDEVFSHNGKRLRNESTFKLDTDKSVRARYSS